MSYCLNLPDPGINYDGDEFNKFSQNDNDDQERPALNTEGFQPVEVEDLLDELSLRRKKVPNVVANEPPHNRFWLHDTPGAINEAQVGSFW